MEFERRHIPNRLRLHRKLLRYKQKDVAALLGLHPSQLSSWEYGKALPGIEHLLKLSIIYSTLPAELYFEYYQRLKQEIQNKQRNGLAPD